MDGCLLRIRGLAIDQYKELYLIFLLFHLGQDDIFEFILIFECQLPHLLYEVEIIEDLSLELVVLSWMVVAEESGDIKSDG